MLKAKHYNTQEEWMYVWNNYAKIKSRQEIEDLIKKTVDEIKIICKGKNTAYAWSGGKDSIALQIVCEDAGIKQGFCSYNMLFFSESIAFFKEYCPQGIVLLDSGEDYNWLANNPKYLFNPGSNDWSVITHLRHQKVYSKKKNIDLMLMGKRSQDGNWVPKNLINVGANGVPIYCPIRNWTHEDVICAIRYRGKKLSSFYFRDGGGFHYGDTKFPLIGPMQGETIPEVWNRVYKLEPLHVLKSAEAGIQSAKQYLIERKKGLW